MSVTELKNIEGNVKFKKDFLHRYLLEAPVALAVERSLECEILSQQNFKRPVLDIGCGEGLFARILFDQKIDCGIDPDAKEIERAKDYGMYNEYVQCWGNKISKEDGAFNTIFSNSVLEHIRDLEPVIKEAYRLLAPGGSFYVTVPTDKFEQYSWINQTLNGLRLNGLSIKFRSFYNRFWKHYHCYSRRKWEDVFKSAGFQVVRSQEYAPRKICLLNDFFVPFGCVAFVMKRLTNRWILLRPLRKLYIGPIHAWIKNYVKRNTSEKEGGIIFFSLVKV